MLFISKLQRLLISIAQSTPFDRGLLVDWDALRSLSKGSVERKSWIKLALEHGERELLQGFIKRSESVSTVVIQNALKLFENEGLLSIRNIQQNNKSSQFLTLGDAKTLEELALRRDELGVYLAGEDLSTQPPGPLPVQSVEHSAVSE